MPEAPRSVGLVLSGGGTRLFAHIGFLWALDDAGLLAPVPGPIGAVVGNSAGSLVGTMLALGYTPRDMWEAAYWRVWGYEVPQEPRAWRTDPRPRGLDLAVDLDFDGLAYALTHHLSHFKGIDTGLRFEALLQRILEREGPDGQPNPDFTGSRPPEAGLPLYLIGFNLTNRRETILQFVGHCPSMPPPSLGAYPTALGREASYEVCCDCDDAGTSPKELFHPWEGVRISTSLPMIFRPYHKPRFVATHWDGHGQPYRVTQSAYLSDGGSRDNYSLSAAIKLAGCDAVLGCYLGDPGYPHELVGTGTALDLVMRNVDGMMQAIFEADQDDAEIIARPVRTVVPHIVSRPGVTFDLTRMGAVMEAGYIAAAYYLRRLRPDVEDDREFLAALVAGGLRVDWAGVFAPGEETWGPAAAGRVAVRGAAQVVAPAREASNYFIIRPLAEFQALAARFFAEQYPAPAVMAAPPSPLEQEIARRNRERREVAPEELDLPPFRDMSLARTQRALVDWADKVSWAAASGIVAGLGSAVLAAWALVGHILRLVPAPDPVEMWAAQLLVLLAAVAAGRLARGAVVRLLWRGLKKLVHERIGF
jgi:predicted acylesterase/phospholipase RssA